MDSPLVTIFLPKRAAEDRKPSPARRPRRTRSPHGAGRRPPPGLEAQKNADPRETERRPSVIVEPGAREVISQGPGVLGGDCGDHAMPRRRRWRLFTEFGGGRPKLDTVMKRSRGANAWNIGYRKRRAARSAPGARLRGQGKGRDVQALLRQPLRLAGHRGCRARGPRPRYVRRLKWSCGGRTQLDTRSAGRTYGSGDHGQRDQRIALRSSSATGSRARRRGPRLAPGSW